jgi:hypothetical protein
VSRSRSTVDFEYQNQLRELNWSLLEADMIADGQLATWDIDSLITSSSLANSRSFQKGFANSGFLYPAAGLHPYEHEHLPLFISPEYMKRGKIVRSVIFSNSRIEDIDAQQMNELLKQVEVAHQHARENQ